MCNKNKFSSLIISLKISPWIWLSPSKSSSSSSSSSSSVFCFFFLDFFCFFDFGFFGSYLIFLFWYFFSISSGNLYKKPSSFFASFILINKRFFKSSFSGFSDSNILLTKVLINLKGALSKKNIFTIDSANMGFISSLYFLYLQEYNLEIKINIIYCIGKTSMISINCSQYLIIISPKTFLISLTLSSI